jgi:hypothetical protein
MSVLPAPGKRKDVFAARGTMSSFLLLDTVITMLKYGAVYCINGKNPTIEKLWLTTYIKVQGIICTSSVAFRLMDQ